ncbi:MAG: hypothetical protein ACJ762_02505 [Solirubrobacteraceae bacterium]
MESPLVQEVWRLGAPRVGVLSGPDDAGEPTGRYGFSVALGEQVGRCFITRSEALGLHQLTASWIERALVNIVLRHGPGETLERLRSDAGLELHADDAADVVPGHRPAAL